VHPRWLNRGVAGIGAASFFSDVGQEVVTSLLPSFLTSTIGAPAAALGAIEGVADGAAGAARLAGGALADDPARRRATAMGGYSATAVLQALIGIATAAWQVGVLRTGAWLTRGLRTPSRNALLTDVVPREAYGRAYGFERALDNFGAIVGPLLALGLIAVIGVRESILLSVVPGFLAAAAIFIAITSAPRLERHERPPLRLRVRPVLRGELGRLLLAVTAFEFGNVAATLLILRATDLLTPERGHDSAVKVALVLYAAYNLAATLASIPAGHATDRRGGIFLVAYGGLAFTGSSVAVLALLFAAAGVGIGLTETAENAAVATLAPENLRGSAFGALAAVQSFGNLAASAVAGTLWTLVSPRAAFLYLGAWMLVSAVALIPRLD
jgi:MFS family permease